MTTNVICRWFGHRFEARYDERGERLQDVLRESRIHATGWGETSVGHVEPYARTYRRDICTRCGITPSESLLGAGEDGK